MKRGVYIVYVFLFLMNAINCKTAKPSAIGSVNDKDSVQVSNKIVQGTKATLAVGVFDDGWVHGCYGAMAYRVSISFYSIGSGINHDAFGKMKPFISDFEKAKNVKISVEEYHWGREGEVDFCLPMINIIKDKQQTFVQQLKEAFGNEKMVTITEFCECLHKNQQIKITH
ncbi:MAG: hypothetical protein WCL14_02515 [Bacteroidota bacterium]